MKKILHIISQYPGKTGSGVYLNELIREGDKKGYKQALVGAVDDEGYENEYIDREDLYLIEFNSGDLDFSIFGMSDEMPYRSKRYLDMTWEEERAYSKAFRESIGRAIENFRPDLIFTHHLWLLSSMVKDLAGDIRVVGVCHGTDLRQLEVVDALRDRVVRGCRKLDLVLALSEGQRLEIYEAYGINMDRVIAVGGGYNSDIFYPDFSPRGRISLVYAGKLSHSKGLMSALRALSLVGKEYDFDFYLAGSGQGSQEEEIRRLAGKIDRRIVFLGELSQKKLGQVFRAADIFIMPSYYEGLSLVALEALASGLLLVSSEIKGLMDHLGPIINTSGIIKYVALPKMVGVDIPERSGLGQYEKMLQEAIEDQLDRLDQREKLYRGLEEEIGSLSWQAIFDKIEEALAL